MIIKHKPRNNSREPEVRKFRPEALINDLKVVAFVNLYKETFSLFFSWKCPPQNRQNLNFLIKVFSATRLNVIIVKLLAKAEELTL